jgi:hypothetical protein
VNNVIAVSKRKKAAVAARILAKVLNRLSPDNFQYISTAFLLCGYIKKKVMGNGEFIILRWF